MGPVLYRLFQSLALRVRRIPWPTVMLEFGTAICANCGKYAQPFEKKHLEVPAQLGRNLPGEIGCGIRWRFIDKDYCMIHDGVDLGATHIEEVLDLRRDLGLTRLRRVDKPWQKMKPGSLAEAPFPETI